METNNPIYPMYAFRHCFERHAAPPHWVMQYVALSFHAYLRNDGLMSSDECLQLKVGKGQTPPFKQFLLDERDDMIVGHMFRLVELMSLSVEEAAYMVKEKLIATDWNKTRTELTELSDGSIADMYRKKHRKWMVEMMSADPDVGDCYTQEKRAAFLTTFPQHCIPSGMK